MPEITGVWCDIGTPEEPLPHVSWVCPACGRWHDDDLGPGDQPPMVFECSRAKYNGARFLVHWDKPDGA